MVLMYWFEIIGFDAIGLSNKYLILAINNKSIIFAVQIAR